ncbi:putative Ig domain-containing protein [Longispora sp. K20-0274]|uniref:putative Ig domain-containing protein n=1 Tax=Longispora sp. K20-0274 TaxID=3088255 RepID=UPI00399B646F
MRKRLVTGLGAVLLAAAVVAGSAAPATAAPSIQATGLNATIALSNCSASLVKFPTSADTDRAMMLTNGHCYEGGMPGAGVVLQNKASTRSGTLLNDSGGSLGTVRADLLIYATMTGTDVSLYRLNQTIAQVQSSFGVSPMTIAASHPADGIAMTIPSGYWKQTWSCNINGFVYQLKEDAWTWKDSIRYNTGCNTTHGTSGSPILDSSRTVVGVNNTGNDDGARCTLNNPCEVDAAGNVTYTQGQSYGQQVYWFSTCVNSSRMLDLTVAGCLLTGASTPGNTVTVTNPGSQTTAQGTAVSKQITATDSAPGQTLTFTATGLPTGLSISSSGLITGTATAAGTYSVTVTAKDTTNASGSTTFTWTVTGTGTCSGQKLLNPGFESGAASWTASSGVIDNGTSQPAHAGSYKAWLNGYGSAHTDTLSQSVAIQAGCHATLSFYLHIDTGETGSTAYDKLTVQAGSTTLATYSNVNAAAGYVLRSFDVSSFAGQTVTIKFTGVEDSSLQTSFVIDDTALTLS